MTVVFIYMQHVCVQVCWLWCCYQCLNCYPGSSMSTNQIFTLASQQEGRWLKNKINPLYLMFMTRLISKFTRLVWMCQEAFQAKVDIKKKQHLFHSITNIIIGLQIPKKSLCRFPINTLNLIWGGLIVIIRNRSACFYRCLKWTNPPS